MDIGTVVSLSVSLFLILDPFASVPIFLKVTEGLDRKTVASYADKAVVVASVLLLVFVFLGEDILGVFGVTIDSFRVAGGIIFLMMAIELVFGLSLSKNGNGKGAAWAVIASPVLTGPGVITAAVIYGTEYGITSVLIASLVSLAATWAVLRMSPRIMQIAGEQSLSIMTKIIGLFIAAMGVQSIFAGTLGWYNANANIILLALSVF